MLYRLVLRPLLYALPPEPAHHLTMRLMRWLAASPVWCAVLRGLCAVRDPRLEVEAFGRRLGNPIGLAAGLDKNAEAYEAFGALGFGHVEVGTVTGEAQPGNPTPRLFRLPRDRALINRMGFNNRGSADAAARIAEGRAAARARHAALGVNIGKTKLVEPEQAAEDYALSAKRLGPLADYMVVNVSSPNTPGLRDLQAVSQLRPLLLRIQQQLTALDLPRSVPLLVKIAPDLADEDLDAVADLALELGLAGIIATNTTVSRSHLSTDPRTVEACGAGGLSGAPLKQRSLEVLRRLRARVGDRLLLVSVGGIENADDAWARIRAGASLVQIYTALIYEGPGLVRRIARGLVGHLDRAGLGSVGEAVGLDLR
jgi:dihydroorotate dehydrogenase